MAVTAVGGAGPVRPSDCFVVGSALLLDSEVLLIAELLILDNEFAVL